MLDAEETDWRLHTEAALSSLSLVRSISPCCVAEGLLDTQPGEREDGRGRISDEHEGKNEDDREKKKRKKITLPKTIKMAGSRTSAWAPLPCLTPSASGRASEEK